MKNLIYFLINKFFTLIPYIFIILGIFWFNTSRKTKIIKKKIITFCISILSIILFILNIIFPFENYIVTFKTPEDGALYTNSIAKIVESQIIDNDKSVVIQKDSKGLKVNYFFKKNNRWTKINSNSVHLEIRSINKCILSSFTIPYSDIVTNEIICFDSENSGNHNILNNEGIEYKHLYDEKIKVHYYFNIQKNRDDTIYFDDTTYSISNLERMK